MPSFQEQFSNTHPQGRYGLSPPDKRRVKFRKPLFACSGGGALPHFSLLTYPTSQITNRKSLITVHCSLFTDYWNRPHGRGEGWFLRRQKPPRTRPIPRHLPFVARITAHAGSEHLLRPGPCGSHTFTYYEVRCADRCASPHIFWR